MRVLHGIVSFEVEDDWVDASQVAYMAPPDAELADELAKQAAASGAPIHMEIPANPKSRSNIQINARPYFLDPGQVEPKEFCEKEIRTMIAQVPGEPGEFAWVKMGEVEAASYEVEIQMEGLSAKQFHALGVIGKQLYHFCGTAGRGDYDAAKPGFLAVVASITVQ